MQRFGQIIGIKPENLEQYTRLHAAVWPEVLQTIAGCNIRNYSIFVRDNWLFAYFEYHGSDFAPRRARMGAAPKTQAWGGINHPLETPLPRRGADQGWAG